MSSWTIYVNNTPFEFQKGQTGSWNTLIAHIREIFKIQGNFYLEGNDGNTVNAGTLVNGGAYTYHLVGPS